MSTSITECLFLTENSIEIWTGLEPASGDANRDSAVIVSEQLRFRNHSIQHYIDGADFWLPASSKATGKATVSPHEKGYSPVDLLLSWVLWWSMSQRETDNSKFDFTDTQQT
jgi:hypothetical protein